MNNKNKVYIEVWGSMEYFFQNETVSLVKMVINPNSRTPLWRHPYRSSVLNVVKNEAVIEIGTHLIRSQSCQDHECTIVPPLSLYRIINDTKNPSEVIVFRTNSYGKNEDEVFQDDSDDTQQIPF